MNKLKLRRLELEFSQYDVEKICGIPQVKISLYERGYRDPSPEERKKLSKLLRMPEEELFDREQ